jgi:hypothetical protein
MAKHTRYYDTRFQAVLAWSALQLIALWHVFTWRRSTHARREPVPPWPTGADLAYAQWLHVENETPVVRPEARA